MSHPSGNFADDPDSGVTEREIEIDVLDALLPCRTFAITYKVAELGKVSLTSEFLLRLIHSVEGILETEAASYFGFSELEIAFVIGELEAAAYVERRNGSLWLSTAGRELFKPGSDTPEVFEVEQRAERHGFDLIALAPTERHSLSSFESTLPELLCNADEVAHASRVIPIAFKRHFDALVRRVTDTPLRQSLYAVDTVTPLKRYVTPVPMRVRAKAELPGLVEPDLMERWTGFELDDREKIVFAAAAFLKSSRISSGSHEEVAFQELLRIAPELLRNYTKDGVFRRESFFREAIRRVGELRVDRPTVLLVGTLFTDRNFARLSRALEYSRGESSEGQGGRLFFWHAPTVKTWGASRRLPQALEAISDFDNEASPALRKIPVGVLQEGHPRFLERAFNNIVLSRANLMRLAPIEAFLVPGRVAAVLVHVPAIGSTESYPVPLGLLSFDKNVVLGVTELMRQLVMPSQIVMSSENIDELESEIADALRA